ncbi:hypothetical protein D3C80_1214140 [compost metagenome]
METLQWRAVMLDEQGLLNLRNHQDFGLGVLGKHCPLILGKVPVAAPAPIQRVTQVLRLVFKTAVGGVVDIQPRHLVETDQAVDWALGQIGLHPGAELLVAPMVEQRLDRRHQHFETFRYITFPDQRVDTDLMATALAFQGNTHEVALQAAEGEVFVQHKSQLH